MKAVGVSQFGGIEKLEYKDIPEPNPGADEILIKNEAAGVNRADLLIRAGLYPVEKTDFIVPGFEVAGEIVKTGKNVKDFKAGDKVFALVDIGGYAEFTKARLSRVLTIPDNLSTTEAAAIPVVWYTAWITLFKKAKLQKNETVLIHSAGSGVGSAAIQLCKYYGIQSITTAGSDEKLKRAQEIGATYLINYNTRDYLSEIKKITNGRGVDVILDGLGGSTIEKNILCLSHYGRLILIGVLGGLQTPVHLGRIIMRNIDIIGFYIHGLDGFFNYLQEFKKEILPLFVEAKIVSLVDKVFPLSDAGLAHQYLEERKNFGKVVLRP